MPRTVTDPHSGLTVTATPVATHWDLGTEARGAEPGPGADPLNPLTCRGPGRRYDPTGRAEDQHSDCTYTYQWTSGEQPGGVYRARVAIEWQRRWHDGQGQGGPLGTISTTTDFALRVIEIQAVVES